ncbi:Large cysteine-rich periplasmic protein OmcB, serovars L1/L3 precursor [Rubripirellula lacrimiformis]|uniref:Large cysteine-rich periplasmic protein OmcB, serovars L1/L3 n=1 Tax=Rubripirellula lacrimiformis TaxID=1930273 RepID=A0A517NCI4_9BACT|nr:DUF11 domain-containing protein [Rubripirellula lacrimiformis]QDT04830.1 Large cysteine-rich periplasmic protein OmcB, serovars L1/L3 precursor [Rubripirellula lacrimiformis]
MDHTARTTDAIATYRLPVYRILMVAIALLVAVSSGCSRLRLPAVDPTGSCLFRPLPTTTSLALPGSGGEGCGCLGCLSGLKDSCLGCCLTKPGFKFPTPAFPEPADPPACPTPTNPSVALGQQRNEPCVPSAACSGSCATGPRAVLLGSEIDKQCGCLPDRGKRGCILLSPTKIVAPVGGEVVLLSGVCGDDGYLQMNEKLEWMLAPDSVGNFIQVGDDEPGVIGRFAGSRTRPEKKDPSYAIGITSTKKTLITRGNNDPRDDVRLEKGQTWITISSPSEGVSHVTVLAPDSECWDQRKSTATIYWVDATAQFPGAEIVPAGTPVELTTRVTRSEKTLPARGWKVRYEIMEPGLATFAGTGGSSVVEATVDDSGNATVQLDPVPGTSGSTAVNMQVIRPGGVTDNLPTLTLGEGQTSVTWSSPKLELRTGGPAVASYNTPYQVVANLRNPGNQAATNVRVDIEIPQGTRIIGTDSFARQLPNGVTWEIGTLPPQTQLDLFLDVASKAPVDLIFQARADGLAVQDSVRVDIFRPSLGLAVAPVEDRVEAGMPVTFNIDVTNNGDRPLTGAYVTATGDSSIIHESGGTGVRDNKDGPLQPGETWRKKVVFTPTQSGRRCIRVDAFTDGGQHATQDACTLVINPIPETPNLKVSVDGKSRVVVGDSTLVRASVTNDGRGEARNVNVDLIFDPQLQLLAATEGAGEQRIGQRIVTWNIPSIAPGQLVVLEGQFSAVAPSPRSRVTVTAESATGSRGTDEFIFEVTGNNQPAQPPRGPNLPPAGTSPEIPGGPAPLQGTPPNLGPGNNAPVTPSGPVRSGRLQTSIFGRDNPVRVNEPIRYSISVTNDSNQRDGQVGIQFALPDGIRMERLVPRTNPELSDYRIDTGVVSLPYIPNLEPGESVDFELVLSSNQAQTFNLNVGVRSLNFPDGYAESVTTQVIP